VSARRARPGEYPNLLPRDVFLEGHITLFRNAKDKPFGERDEFIVRGDFESLDGFMGAYARAEAAEQQLARQHAFAWDPAFGFLSADPAHCGTGLKLEGTFHLEGLHLIGDLPLVLAGLEAVRFESSSVTEDGIQQAAHVFRVSNRATLGLPERVLVKRARTIFQDLITQEIAARKALVEDTPRVFEDSLTRALALLRHARLLAPGELLDLLSPIRLAVTMGFLDGITRAEVVRLMNEQLDAPELPPSRCPEDDKRRDERDARLADRINDRFRAVDFNDRADAFLS